MAANHQCVSTCFISAFRVIFLKKPVDSTWDAIAVLCWSHAELSSGIICASVPTLKPLVGKYFPALGSARQSSKGYRKYEYHSKHKEFNTSKSTELSTKDTGIYGLTDLEVGLTRPHPVKIETGGPRTTRHSPTACMPGSTHSVHSPFSQNSTEDILDDTRTRRPRRGGWLSSHEIRVERGWSLSSHKV